jgi:hypothetical protein
LVISRSEPMTLLAALPTAVEKNVQGSSPEKLNSS